MILTMLLLNASFVTFASVLFYSLSNDLKLLQSQNSVLSLKILELENTLNLSNQNVLFSIKSIEVSNLQTSVNSAGFFSLTMGLVVASTLLIIFVVASLNSNGNSNEIVVDAVNKHFEKVADCLNNQSSVIEQSTSAIVSRVNQVGASVLDLSPNTVLSNPALIATVSNDPVLQGLSIMGDLFK